MAKNARTRSRTNALVTLVAVVGIAVLLNIASTWVFGWVDLTQNHVHTLSTASKEAVRALDDLEVRVYVSESLPNEIDVGYGQKIDPRRAAQAFLDKLDEYKSYSDGEMTLLRVKEGLIEKAEKARLRLFSAEEARVSQRGQLEFQRYALGATFSYKNVTEVLPLALQPERLEFEVTKILLRLHEKAAQSRLMDDILETGKDLFETVQSCNAAVSSAMAADEDGGEGGFGLGADPLQKALGKLAGEMPAVQKACAPVEQKLATARETMGKSGGSAAANADLERLFASVSQFLEFYGQLVESQAQGTAEQDQSGQRALQLAGVLGQIFGSIDRDYQLLVDSPGRKTIGFVCGHQEFCPFAADQPLMQPELVQIFGQKNPLVQRFAQQAQQLEGEIDQLNESIRNGLFTTRGFDIRKVALEEDGVPDDIDALVVFGPRKPLPAEAEYELDQFLLSGRPVVVFVNRFDVAVRNFDAEGNLTVSNLTSTESNVQDWLEKYGVKVSGELVLQPERNAPIVLTELVRQGQLVWQSQRAFPYPLLPTFTTFNPEHPLVSGLSSVTLPYVSPIDTTKAVEKGLQATWLVKSDEKAVARSSNIPVLPPELLEAMQTWDPGGPYDVVVAVAGTFESAFKGQEKPGAAATAEGEGDAAPKKEDALAKRRDSGEGRLLVIGSGLGLENLSAERVFEGFDMSELAQGGFEFIEKSRDWAARYQNWRWRLQQLGETLEDSVLVLQNVLDWSVQNEALLAIRAKGDVRRPLAQVSEGEQRVLKYAGILAAPVLFLLFGFVRWQIRRRRRPTL